MAEGIAIAGVSISTLALVISLVCLMWILFHIGQRKGWLGSGWYGKYDIFRGGSREFF